METASQLLQAFEKYLSQLHFPQQPQNLYAPIRYSLQVGGKRIRPLACILAAQLYSDEVAEVFPVAAAYEVFHNFTLLHDDLMDDSDVRRNMPSVPKKFGINAAILSGDRMLIAAYELLSVCNASVLPELLIIFNRTAAQVCEGQQMDMDFENSTTISLRDYVEMIRLKTAVLLAACLESGALVAGDTQNIGKSLYEMGVALGVGFQLQDDYLDCYGNEQFGKPIGKDIVNGKKTYLYLHCLANLTEKDRIDFLDIYQNNAIAEAEKIEKILAYFQKTDTQAATWKIAESYFKQAENILQDNINIAYIRKEPLSQLIKQLQQRSV
ncbi:MAG: polyprenyl synthetase family protein [Chitinophagales bacterium]|nr:polyprenyl synthetase family protein [Bacteroidota bacterium]